MVNAGDNYETDMETDRRAVCRGIRIGEVIRIKNEFEEFDMKEDFRLFFASDMFSMLREHREVIIF